MKRWFIILGIAGLAGCARFESHPLAPAQTASQLEGRRLDDAGLKKFLEQNLGHDLGAWPLPVWDLDSLSLAAFYYHPSLAVARAQWAVARSGIKTAAARPNPTLNVTPGYDTTATAISPWLPLGNLDWPLETAGKRGKRIAAAEALADSARWDLVTAAWQVRSTVRDTLLDWRVAERRKVLLEQQYSLQKQVVKRLKQRAEAGDIARSELLTAQIALQKMQMDRLDAETKSSDAHVRLAGALGLSSAALEGIRIQPDLSTNLPVELTTPEARQLALTGRSDILGALADYQAAEADVRLEIAKQYPDVHVSPGYQYNQGDNQWTLGLTLELPLLNQNQGPIAEAEARRKLVAAKFMALQAQVIGQIDQAVAGYQLAQKQLSSSESLLTAERQQQAVAEAQLKAGATDQFDWLTAQLEQAAAAVVQLDSITQLQHSRGALEDALQHPLDTVTATAIQRLSAMTGEKEIHP